MAAMAVLTACGGGAGDATTASADPAAKAMALPGLQAAIGSAAPVPLTSTGTASVTLSWDAPVIASDGRPTGAMLGYHVYYGRVSGQYAGSLFVSASDAASATVTGLGEGTWYFTVTAVDADGNESNVGHELSKTL